MRTIILIFAWLSLSAASYSQSLVAYYPFNGNANDESGNGIHLTNDGATLNSDRFGNTGRAYYFNGSAKMYANDNDLLDLTSDFSISFWIKRQSTALYQFVMSKHYSGIDNTGSWGIANYSADNLSFVATPFWGDYSVATPIIPQNEWKQVAFTYNKTSSEWKFYVNGILGNSGMKAFTIQNTTNQFMLGACMPNEYHLNASLDDIRIYNLTLSGAEVLQLHQNESTGIVASFPFNGNANDESGNGNNGTVNGATLTTDRFGNSNKAYNFNGANNFISVADNPELFSDELTLSWWYKVPEYSGGRVVIGWVNGGNRYQQFFNGNSIAYFNGYYNSCCYFNPVYGNLTVVNEWQHVAVTYKKTNTNESVTRLYINGELKQTDNYTAAMTYTPGFDLFIGKNHNCCYFNGDLDDIRIYKRSLSPNEIMQLADVSMMPDLLAYLPMNGNANDMSGNGYNGTVVNAPPATDKYDNANSAYQFNGDGTGTSITLANSTSLDFLGSPFTISTWVKCSDNTGPPKVIAGKHNCGSATGYFIGVENNKFAYWLATTGNSWSQVTTTETYNDGKWHHIVGSYDGVNQKLYVDGIFKAGTSTTYNTPASGAPIKVGEPSGGCGGSGLFNGKVDEVKIYAAALGAAQVTTLYKQSRGSGHAVNFDGVDDYIVTNEYLVPTTGDFTVELWVYNRNINGYREFLSQGGGGAAFYIGTSDLTGNIRLGDTWATTVVLPQNKWVHLAVVKSGPNGVLYMDGIQVATSTAYSVGAGGTQTQIGKQYGPHLENVDAILDDIRIWNTALSAAEVRDWMNRKIMPNHPAFTNLVSYYNFDEKNVLRTYEMKGAKTGMLVNGPQYVTSGAPIGDASVHNIATPLVPATLTLSTGENFSALQGVGTALGLYVYVVKDPPEIQTGILGLGSNDHYFGVKKAEDYTGGTTASYTATYNYTGNPYVSGWTEPTLQLFKRTDNSANSWTNSGATLNTTANTLTVAGQNTEYILGSSGFALPVTLLSVEAKKLNATTAQLNWKTAQEINNKGFEVQRSFDGGYFVNIGFVNGAGNSDIMKEYSLTDIPGKTGRVYYRLKQIDMDGNGRLSNIVSIIFDKAGLIKLYPNPAQQYVIVEGLEKYSRIQVIDVTGKLVKDIANNQRYQIKINLAGLKNGNYFIRLMNEKETETIRFNITN